MEVIGYGYSPITTEQIADFGPCSLIYTQDAPISANMFGAFVSSARYEAELQEALATEAAAAYEEAGRRWPEVEALLAERGEDEGRNLTAADIVRMIVRGEIRRITRGLIRRMFSIADQEIKMAGEMPYSVQILLAEALEIMDDLREGGATASDCYNRAIQMLIVADDCDCTDSYMAAVISNPRAPLGAFSQD